MIVFSLVAMATLYFLEFQKRSSLEWSAVAGGGILAIAPVHIPTSQSTPDYESRFNPLLYSTPSPYTRHGTFTRGIDGHTLLKNALSTQSPNTKQQLYSQEITWYPGSQNKHDKNR